MSDCIESSSRLAIILRKLLIILSLGILSCGNASRENTTVSSGAKNSLNSNTLIPSSDTVQPGGDPLFVVSKNVTSSFGPQSITRNILLDRNGNIWFASWEGIIRYDGKEFTNVTLKEGLVRYHVFSVFEDNGGNIWFGMVGGGVYKYDGKTYVHYAMMDGLANNSVMCIGQDLSGDIWFGTFGGGISRFNGNSFLNYSMRDGLTNDFVNCIVIDKSGKLWCGTRGGISCFDPVPSLSGKKSFTDFKINEHSYFHNVRSLFADREGNLWIGSDEGTHRYDLSASEHSISNALEDVSQDFPGNVVFEDKAGNYWLSGSDVYGKNMSLYLNDRKTITKIYSGLQVFGVAEDREGRIWFGTVNGACRYNYTQASINHTGEFSCFVDSVR